MRECRPTLRPVVLLLGGFLALALPALASRDLTCPAGAALVRIDMRACSPLPRQPAPVVRRACCQTRSGKTACGPFPACPARSPS